MDVSDPTYTLHHLGEDKMPHGAVSPPIFQSSIFSFESFDTLRDALAREYESLIYTRGNNPTVCLCEEKLAALEHGERAKLFSSGTAAISAAILSCVRSGDHIIAIDESYGWSRYIIGEYLRRFGVECTFTASSIEAVEQALRPSTRLIYLESPTSLTFRVQNLREIAALAKFHDCTTIIDNTWATPLFQNPLDFGIDLVVHSASKYLGGGSDIIAGAIVGSGKRIQHIFNTEFMAMGQVPDPLMAWLLLRGMRTLHLRMPAHYRNALEVIDYLSGKNEVGCIHYPLLPAHPDYRIASSQMSGGAGLFSIELNAGGVQAVRQFVDALEIFRRAVSWGGYESLVFPAAASFPAEKAVPEERRNLIRLHIGLESVNLLINDLERGFKAIERV